MRPSDRWCWYSSFFQTGYIDVVPLSHHLQELAVKWIETISSERLAFYSAEEKVVPEPPRAGKASPAMKAKAKAPSRKVTTATWSEQISPLAQAIPAISSQLAAMQGRQDRMEALMMTAAPSGAQRPAHRRDFEQLPLSPQALSRTQLMATATSGNTWPFSRGRASYAPRGDGGCSVSACATKGSDVTGGSYSPGWTSRSWGKQLFFNWPVLQRVSEKREADGRLCKQKGGFLLKVIQNAFKRLKPTEALPHPSRARQCSPSTWSAGQRDLGLVMWLCGR